MFKSFFDEFQLPKPDVNLAMRSGSYACQIGQTMDARIVLTDNGCLQEETTVLSVPCLTLRWNTERPVTLIEDGGTSQLVGNNPTRILDGFQMPGTKSRHTCPPALRNGHTAERIVQRILQ
jgi:UDP-N-acetylglucosamine 2-epimerase (non-hydrolysing)